MGFKFFNTKNEFFVPIYFFILIFGFRANSNSQRPGSR